MAKSSVAVLGIDLGKNSCSLVGFDPAGAVILRRRARRETIVGLTAKLPACVVAMEACCGAHHLGRLLAAQGHTIRLMSPEYVRPYVKAQKNDDRDAEAIAEAATRPTTRFVPLKAQEQLDMQSLHRVRSRLVGMRTMLMNQLRAILLERGLAFPQGRRKFETAIETLLMDPKVPIGARIRSLVAEIREEWSSLDRRIATLDREFVEHARLNEAARRLATIPGVEPIQPRLCAQRSMTQVLSRTHVICRLGSALCHASIRPVANPDCSASASGGMLIYAGSSSTGREQPWRGLASEKWRALSVKEEASDGRTQEAVYP